MGARARKPSRAHFGSTSFDFSNLAASSLDGSAAFDSVASVRLFFTSTPGVTDSALRFPTAAREVVIASGSVDEVPRSSLDSFDSRGSSSASCEDLNLVLASAGSIVSAGSSSNERRAAFLIADCNIVSSVVWVRERSRLECGR